MMRFLRATSTWAGLILLATLALPDVATATASAQPADDATAPIYVLRGGLNIFSTGMDMLAKELNAKGIPAVAENFMDWKDALAKIVAAYKAHPYPIVIIGHSYGANTALLMAYKLAENEYAGRASGLLRPDRFRQGAAQRRPCPEFPLVVVDRHQRHRHRRQPFQRHHRQRHAARPQPHHDRQGGGPAQADHRRRSWNSFGRQRQRKQ